MVFRLPGGPLKRFHYMPRRGHVGVSDAHVYHIDPAGAGLLVALGDPFGDFLFLFEGEEGGLADFLEVILDGIEAPLSGAAVRFGL